MSEKLESFLDCVWVIPFDQRKWKDFVMLDSLHAFCGGLEPTVEAWRLDTYAHRCKFLLPTLLLFGYLFYSIGFLIPIIYTS